MLTIGCHLTSSKGFERMGLDAISIGANTFQFFTRNPRGGQAKDIDLEDVARYQKLAKEHHFGKIVAHSPYTLNPCGKDPKVRDFAYMVMADDLSRMEVVPGNYYNFHPGSHVGQGIEVGIEKIAELLNDIMTEQQSTIVLLETMAGKGTEVGSKFEEIREIMDRVWLKEKIGVLMDTCHVNDAGYDMVQNMEGVLAEFDQVIGLSWLKAVHINDSKNPFGAHKDRHEKIGEGTIGFEAIANFINHPAIRDLPCILETPHDELSGYQEEIDRLKATYHPDFFDTSHQKQLRPISI
jgi:deoxyribonuclease-4